jgi:uncharacterized membrane protein (UPF0127 family)
MKTVKILMDGRVIVQTVFVADSYFSRLKGLMFCKCLENTKGLLLIPCNQIHTFFMKFSIDAVFMDKFGKVLHIEDNMKPGKISPHIKKGWQVLELAAGQAGKNDIETGSQFVIEKD